MILLTSAFTLPTDAAVAANLVIPESFGSNPSLTLTEKPRSWNAETMYEHINGEAELLKRYGAADLTYAFYEAEDGAYLSADILDMRAPLNAYGLYRLYAGCDETEHRVGSARVLSGEFTSYAYVGPYFLRVDFDAGEASGGGRTLADSFIEAFSRGLAEPDPLPAVIARLSDLSRNSCEVFYHPEHIDYDLESGPGFSWIGTSGSKYHVSFLQSPEDARNLASGLKNRGAPLVVVSGSAVAWPKASSVESEAYLKNALEKIIQ